MRTNIDTLNKVALGLINGEIDTTDIKNSIANFQNMDVNDKMNEAMINDIVYDLENTGIIHPSENGYTVIDGDIFINVAKSDVSHIAYASENIIHEDGTSHTRLSPVDTQKSVFWSTDIMIIGSEETQTAWDETKINNAKASKPLEFDFTRCENIEMISPELLAEITHTPGLNGDFCATFPKDKEIFILQGDDAFNRMYGGDELIFQNGDAILLNGYTFTYNEELNGFVRNQVAIDTTKESELDSVVPENLHGFQIYLSQKIADKVLAGETLTPEDEKQIIFPIEEEINNETGQNINGYKPHISYTGNMSPENIVNTYSVGSNTFYPAHQGDIYEQNLANKLNEIEYRRLEAEGRINKIQNDIKEQKRLLNQGPWFLKLGRTLFWKPLKFLGRLFKKMLGREIKYSPEELKIKDLKESLEKEYEDAIRIQKEQKTYMKTHDIKLDKGDTVTERTVIEQPVSVKKSNVDNNIEEAVVTDSNIEENISENKEASQTRKPNISQVFGNMFQGLCNDYNIDVNAYSEKNTDGKYVTAVELSTKTGEITKFEFDHNKGILNPVSYSTEQIFTPEIINDLQNKAYVAYTIAAIKCEKDIVSDKYINYLNEKHIAPLLSGERRETEFKMGNIPVTINTENGVYKIAINPNKETKQGEIEMHIPEELLKPESLKITMFTIKSQYALKMYKSMINEQFIDFAKTSAVIKKIKNAYVLGATKNNNEMTFDIKLPDEINNNEMIASLKLNTENFSIESVQKDLEAEMTNAQRIAFTKMAAKLEEAYSSFIFSKSKMPPNIALPSPDNLSSELNNRIDNIEKGTSETFYAYGLKIDVNKEENEYPVMRISTKDNNILTEMPLYEGQLDVSDLDKIYADMVTGLEIEARIYNKAEAAILNAQKDEQTFEDVIFDKSMDASFYGTDNGINAENEAIDRVLSTVGGEERD